MKNLRLTSLLVPLLLALFMGLVIRYATDKHEAARPTEFLDLNDVQGSEVVYQAQPYTLGFEQQKGLIELINRCTVVKALRTHKAPFSGIEKIVIYRFSAEPVELVPVDIDEGVVFLRAPSLEPSGFLKDSSPKTLWNLLQQTYDK